MELRAFHGKQETKDFYLSRVRAHKLADEIIKGTYWENGKGCAVGCTLHNSNHAAYETELGIPIILARLEDGIFEGLPLKRAKLWPEEFLDAIAIGANLLEIWPKFAVWLLIDKENGVIQYAKNDIHRNAIQTIADYYSRYKEISDQQWRDAAHAAAYAANDVYAADVAAYAAAYAAHVAAYAAAYAADAAAYAAVYAVHVADAADAAASDAEKQNHRIAQADKLLELLRACK